jgi:hypothetical protein
MFEFLSLASVKRYSEVIHLEPGSASGRGYRANDYQLLSFSGVASGYMAVLVFALYINNSPDVPVLYSQPYALWAICPFLLYWIQRVWLLALRGAQLEDPVAFAFKDSVSYFVGGAIAVILWMAI